MIQVSNLEVRPGRRTLDRAGPTATKLPAPLIRFTPGSSLSRDNTRRASVAADARGKGVGYELLRWAESRAREHHSRFLTLTVLNGNPARRLYERFGFQPKPTDCCEDCIVGLFVVCFFGRPYGLCNPHYGITEMHKSLT